MTLAFAVPMQSGDDVVLQQLNDYCNLHHINLIVGQGIGYHSLLFTGNNEVIEKLKVYLEQY